ncbi:hypothetical protein IV203_003998 [Nitzschia inconspicua]|uniref:Fe2OG dioxygenase domain-containing protein n=1 Tax=Nitzschia inconspicua TaxID=303405 RepID=A0A9K3PPA8_9STRA|nr:hypothetical protein IV203_003998 [Nitzschia inconspicua]
MMKMRHTTEKRRQRRGAHQQQPPKLWCDTADQHKEKRYVRQVDYDTPPKSQPSPGLYLAPPDRQDTNRTRGEFSTPQKPPQLVLYPNMYLHRMPCVQPNHPWAMAPPPPQAPIKTHQRTSRLFLDRNLEHYPVATPLYLSCRPTSASSSPASTSSSPKCPVTPPAMRQNPISPPCPVRKSSLDSSSRSFILPPSLKKGNEKGEEEEPTKVVVYRDTYPNQRIVYEHVGLPHLKIFKVKLPQTLIDTCLDPIIEGSEKHALSLRHGWKTELYSLTKCDVACRDIPGIQQYVQPVFHYVCQAINVLYGTARLMVDKNQPHVLKYSAAMGHTGVELHHDRCDVTANLSLSDRSDYEGGGTMIVDIGRVVKLEKGEVLLHPGSLVHGGMDICGGTRFLLVTFAHFQ